MGRCEIIRSRVRPRVENILNLKSSLSKYLDPLSSPHQSQSLPSNPHRASNIQSKRSSTYNPAPDLISTLYFKQSHRNPLPWDNTKNISSFRLPFRLSLYGVASYKTCNSVYSIGYLALSSRVRLCSWLIVRFNGGRSSK